MMTYHLKARSNGLKFLKRFGSWTFVWYKENKQNRISIIKDKIMPHDIILISRKVKSSGYVVVCVLKLGTGNFCGYGI